MRLVGLTGGIATGKSTVARRLVARGAALVDADALAREVVEPGRPALADIAAAFGPAVLRGDGSLDRPALAAVVFADAAARARLEAITHPRIHELTGERILAALASDAPLVVVDVPLLYEKGREAMFEGVLVVWCDAATQVRRMVERDGLDEAAARARLAAQMDVAEKRRRATWVIDNSGSVEECLRQVDAWWEAWVATANPRRGGSALSGS